MKQTDRWVGLWVLLVLACGCGRAREAWPEFPPPEQPVTILESGDGTDEVLRSHAEAILRDAFPNAHRLRVEQLVTAGPGLRQSGSVLVIPMHRNLRRQHWSALTNHVARGGLALYWGLLPDARADAAGVLPEAPVYSFHAREIRGLPAGRLTSSQSIALQGLFPGPRQWSPSTGKRWIPLAEGYENGEVPRGWLAALQVGFTTGGTLRAWGWIGWNPDKAFERAQRSLLRQAATRLQRRQFLLRAGLDRYAIDAGDPFLITVELGTATPTQGTWRIAAEIENSKGVVTRRHTELLASTGSILRHTAVFSLGASARRSTLDAEALLRLSIVDVGGAAPFDEICQPIRILAPPLNSNAGSAEALGIRGLGFTRGRRPLPLMGAAFDLITAGGTQSPLASSRFDPVLMSRELALFEEAGFNITSITYSDSDQTPQLRLLLEELRDRQLRVLLELPALSPWAPDWGKAAGLMRDLRLAPDQPIFALSPGPVLQPVRAIEQAAFREAWQRWVTEQYGDKNHAEKLLGCPPETITATNAWGHAEELPVAARFAIRRFLEDWDARHFDACRQFLAREGWTGFLTAGCGLALDPAAGAHQLDFITLDARLLDVANPARLAFYTAYARAVSGGKPVLWTGLTVPIANPAAAPELGAQARIMDRALAALLKAQAAGIILGSLTGGARDPGGADTGVVSPDNRWRESGQRVRARAQDWRREQIRPVSWRGREVETVSAHGGLESVWATEQKRFSEELAAGIVEELRPAGWGRMTGDLPPTGLGGTPHENPAPFHDVNAVWHGISDPTSTVRKIAAAREPIKLDLVNIGLAAWSPSITGRVGSVWISASRPGARAELLPVRETPPGSRAQFTWTPADPGRWTLRPWLHPAGPFGQALEIEVE